MTTTTIPRTPNRLRAVLRYPAIWLIIGIAVIAPISILVGAGPAPALIASAAALVAYWAVMRFVAGRRTPELSLRRVARDALTGAGIGAGFLALSVGIVTLLGGYHFTFDAAAGLKALPELIAVTALGGAVTEEVLFRGLALQAVEKLGGSWIALGLTAALFGLIHALNPGATLWSSIAIAVEAGGVMGAAFLWKRSLWLVIALHATWNGLEQALGIPVSGHIDPSLVIAKTSGATLLTGGDFGIEGSLVSFLVSLTITAALLLAARHRGTLHPLRHTR